ncbi:MAG: HyaD/HybD family hydrogenase maturation endopeptidase [Gammaproteobacteria bacterium]|nr:HyaD/HybD family hydrogenase maturation endopeptidase [Gammaproteobacteria bacterium]MBL6998797.1 HyaD/HybD family hydrogenase maturation endopeptidase [Gammaproteobacteria bacterium]
MLTISPHKSPKTLILGIGNTLLTDEGIGIHVMRELADSQLLLGNIEFLDGGTLSFTLASPIEDCQQFIVIDASEINSKPGTVQVFENEQMDHFISTGNKKSVHEVGLVDVMSIAMLSGRLPAKRALIGIQPDILDWGEAPTEPVRQAIPVACQHVHELLQKWQA